MVDKVDNVTGREAAANPMIPEPHCVGCEDLTKCLAGEVTSPCRFGFEMVPTRSGGLTMRYTRMRSGASRRHKAIGEYLGGERFTVKYTRPCGHSFTRSLIKKRFGKSLKPSRVQVEVTKKHLAYQNGYGGMVCDSPCPTCLRAVEKNQAQPRGRSDSAGAGDRASQSNQEV